MLEKRDNSVFSNDGIDLDDIGSETVTFFSDGMGHILQTLNNVSLDDYYFDKDDPYNIVLTRVIVWCNRLKHRKGCKKKQMKN